MKLIVIMPFENYQKGDEITDALEVERVLAAYPQCVVTTRAS